MKGLVLVGLVVVAAAVHGAAAKPVAFRAPPPTTLATVSGSIEGFGQDGNHIVWATTGHCGRNVVLRTLSTGASRFLDGPKGPMCPLTEYAGEIQPWMALAGTRALWAWMNVSLSHYNFSLFTAAPGDGVEHEIAEMSIEGGLSDEGDALHPVPVAGHGQTLVFADINTDEGEPSGVYRVIGKRVRHVDGTERAFAVAVSGSRFALARAIPGGCACNSDPAWSPDGRRIAFRSGGGETDSVYAPSQLVVMNADGTNARRVLANVNAFAWAPNGESLAAWQQEGSTNRLVVVEPDGSGARAIAPGGASFAWAPNGRWLAYFEQSESGEVRLFVVAPDGGTAVDLGKASGANGGVEWSADSQRLAYTRLVGDQTHVYVASVASRSASDIGLGTWPSWAPDGSALTFAQDDGVYVAAADGSARRRLAPASSALPRWSPDGRWIAFHSDQGLSIVSPRGGPPRKLADNPGEPPGVEWSPDSRAIAYWDNGRVAVVDIASGSVRRFSTGSDALANWSPDGTRLIGVANDEITVFDAHSGAATTLTHTDVSRPRTVVETHSPAGKLQSSFDASQELHGLAWGGSRFALLVGRSKTRATIEIRSARGKLLRTVNVPRPRFDELSMSGRWVVFQMGKSVRLLDAATGRTAVLARAQGASIVGLSIDGHRVAWAESNSKRSRIRAVLLPVA